MTAYQAENSRIRVGIQDEGYMFGSDALHFYLGIKYSEQEFSVMRFGPEGLSTMESANDGVVRAPTFVLPSEFAYALLNALVKHFQGAEDTRTIRADLMHERGRVDRLITALTDTVDKLAEQ